jgi:hypothetical protein
MDTVVPEGLTLERQEQLQAILELSEQMLALAENREWEVLAAVEPTRRQLLHRFFSAPPAAEEVGDIALLIQRVLAMDRQIVQWGEVYRRVLMEGLGELGRARRAFHAYGAQPV